jgi:hypothetical protein
VNGALTADPPDDDGLLADIERVLALGLALKDECGRLRRELECARIERRRLELQREDARRQRDHARVERDALEAILGGAFPPSPIDGTNPNP